MVLVSVVVPCRNRAGELRRCLESLDQQQFPKEQYEVLVCDDGSEEDLESVIREMDLNALKISYYRQAPKGPAAARNLGIRLAQGQIIAMTDSDTVPRPDWLAKLYRALADNPQAVAVEGKVYAENEGEYAPLGEGPTNKSGGVYLTCNCAYRREVLLKAGGFDETFPYAAYEDVELAARVQEFGEIIWQPEAIVIHPERRLSLSSVLKKLRHWEYVLIVGFRYGYLAWKKYPVTNPRLRVAILSTLALPLAKFKKAVQWSWRKPAAALKLSFYGVVESVGAFLIVAPKALFSNYVERVVRRNYLNQ
jgi:glycosyltransferase involved in cell wall biosynthesis